LVEIKDERNQVVACYEYDGLHRRIVKSHLDASGKTVWTHFIYGADNQVVEERETDSREALPLIPSRQYIYDSNGQVATMLIGSPQAFVKGSNVRYAVRTDRLIPLYNEEGSTVAVLSQGPYDDAKFVLQYRVEYDPLGNARKLSPTFEYASDQWESEEPFPFLFGGQRYDADTGLYHTEGGQYHPRLGAVANPAVSGYELPSQHVQSIVPQEVSGAPEDFMSFAYNPTIPEAKTMICTVAHTIFAVGGMIPVYGALFDIADAILYTAEGDRLSAGFSLAAAVPGIGDVAAGAKWVKNAHKAVNTTKKLSNAAKLGRAARNTALTGIKYRRQADIGINFIESGYYIHHGVKTGNPWEIGIAAFGIGLNGVFSVRMLKNAGGFRGILSRRSAPKGGRHILDPRLSPSVEASLGETIVGSWTHAPYPGPLGGLLSKFGLNRPIANNVTIRLKDGLDDLTKTWVKSHEAVHYTAAKHPYWRELSFLGDPKTGAGRIPGVHFVAQFIEESRAYGVGSPFAQTFMRPVAALSRLTPSAYVDLGIAGIFYPSIIVLGDMLLNDE
jgi:hypothetical protein